MKLLIDDEKIKELEARIAELEALIPTKEEAIAIINNYRGMCTFPPLVPWCNECLNYDCDIRGLRAKLQKIAGGEK